jgi:hypothetical protein
MVIKKLTTDLWRLTMSSRYVVYEKDK